MNIVAHFYSATMSAKGSRSTASRSAAQKFREKIPAAVRTALLALLAISICGYHPYAEDAGIYVAGVKLRLNSHLYPRHAAFVTAYMHLSAFSFLLAEVVRLTHLPVDYILLGAELGATWLLLYSCWQLARRCFQDGSAQWGAVTLVAIFAALPVAGTALFLMDPYLTGRSFSTPLTLLAICFCLDGRPWLTILFLAWTAVLHPLMAIYAVGFVLFLWAIRRRAWRQAGALSACALLCGAVLQFSQRNITETPAYVSAALSRSYFYLERWQWFEWLGLAAPLLLLFLLCRWRKLRWHDSVVALGGACIAEGLTAIAVSLLFCRPYGHTHLIARLQPLRTFDTIYLILFLMLGGLLGKYFLKCAAWRWAAVMAVLSAAVLSMQLAAFPASRHLELPWGQPRNGWTRAFLWIRGHTPPGAVFAMDADYIVIPGEDSQVFRALAERASLADYWKDGGTAAVFPQLAPQWMREQTAQRGLDSISDQDRVRRLNPFGVAWIVLPRSAQTGLVCPYENGAAMVCRLD